MLLRLSTMLAFLCISLMLNAQGISNAVTIDPPNAAGTDSITLTFDARLSCEAGTWATLEGATEVRMHSGVQINGSVWSNVVSYENTAYNGQSTALTDNGDSTWSITFVPDAFYGVNGSSQIEQLCMVFNNNSWNKTGKDYDQPGHCIDFYIPLAVVPSWNASFYSLSFPVSSPERTIYSLNSWGGDGVWAATAVSASGNTHYPGFVRTTKGGFDKYERVLYDYPNYYSPMIAAAGPDSAWMIAYSHNGTQDGLVLFTSDGGYNWTHQSTALFQVSQGGFPNIIHFWNHTDGIVMGDPSGGYWEIYTTSNAGTNWIRVDSSNIPPPLAGEYGYTRHSAVEGNTIWFTTNRAQLYISNDRGQNWTRHAIPFANNQMILPAMKSPQEGWLYSNDQLYSTNDGGISWTQVIWSGDFRRGRDLKYVKGTANALVSAGGMSGASYSLDGGVSWLPMVQNGGNGVYSLAFTAMDYGWAGGRTDSNLQNYIYKFLTPMTEPVAQTWAHTAQVCAGEYVNFNTWVIGNVWTIHYSFYDGQFPFIRHGWTPLVFFNVPESKDVQVEITGAYGMRQFLAKDVVLVRDNPPVDLGPDTLLCAGQCIELEATSESRSLFFSAYLEGGYSNNNALEIFNPLDVAVDLSAYGIRKNFNGSSWDGFYPFPSATFLDPGETFLIAHALADSAITAKADVLLSGTDYNFMMSFSGNDVRALVKIEQNDTIVVDIIGAEDLSDPGWAWNVAGVWGGTTNHTLVRKGWVQKGQTDWGLSAGLDSLSSEWIVYPPNQFAALGQHTSSPFLTYLWPDGDTAAVKEVCLQANDYNQWISLEVTNAHGCNATDWIKITKVIIPVEITGPDSICLGQCAILTANEASDYVWNTGDSTRSITVCPNYSQWYSVTITDSNGCMGVDGFYLNTWSIQPVIQSSTDSICGDETATLSAPGYATYQWSTGDTTPTTEAWHWGSYNWWYHLTVTDSNGCTGSSNINIWHFEKPSSWIIGDTSIMEGECTQLTSLGGNQYLWSTGENTQAISVCPSNTTTYTVETWFNQQSFCSDTASVTVYVQPAPQLTISNDTSICPGECVTLTATGQGSLLWSDGSTTSSITVCPEVSTWYNVTLYHPAGDTLQASVYVGLYPVNIGTIPDRDICEGECVSLGAFGGIQYTWSNGSNLASPQVCPLSSTMYYVTATNSYQCTGVDSVFVTVHPIPVAEAGANDTIFGSGCVTLTASGGDTYVWSNGMMGPSISVCNTQTTVYYVSAYSYEGCLDVDSVTVTYIPGPVLTVSNDTTLCPGECATLYANGSGNFLWSDGSSGNQIQVCPQSPVTYGVTLTDQYGLQSIDSIHIDIYAAPSVNISGDDTLCEGDCATLVAHGAGEYLWDLGGSSMNIMVCPATSTTYSVTLTDSNGCQAVDSFPIIVFPFPLADAGQDTNICEGDCITLTASGGGTYQWSDGTPQGASTLVCPAQASTYVVTVTNEGGCASIASVNVGILPRPQLSITADTSIQPGECVDLQVLGGDSWLWSNGLTTSTINVCPSQTTLYGVTATSTEGCSEVASVRITVVQPVQGFGLKAFLQGAWLGNGLMRTNLAARPEFPLNQPYNRSPWNYNGSESLDSVHLDMVDWMLMEVRYGSDGSQLLERRALMLWKDGVLRSPAGDTSILIGAKGEGRYRILLDHHSHIPVMTAEALNLDSVAAIDFTDTLLTRPFGGMNALIPLGGNAFGMISGDLNVDKKIKYSGAGNDRSLILQRLMQETGSTVITSTVSGYFPEDLNMDGTVKYSGAGNDPSRIITNLITLTGSTAINTVYTSPIPDAVDTFRCGLVFIDTRDGKMYTTVEIGDQCWMAENLNVGTMIQANSNPSNDGVIEKHCYNDDPAMCDLYGGLYQWEEMMEYMNTEGSQGICPLGWHLPTDAEWCTLTAYLDPTVNCNTWGWSGTDAGGMMKETDTTHWLLPNTGANNSSGFTALGAGYRISGNFIDLRSNAYFWSSSESSSIYGASRALYYYNAAVSRDNNDKTYGFSVRCLRDSIQPCLPQPEQANAGPDSLNIEGDSVQLWANTPSVGPSTPLGASTGQWAVASTSLGNPGIFSDSSAADAWFYGVIGETYILVWTISNQCGSSSDTVMISFAPATTTFTCGDSLLDTRDGQKYATVQIGTQCWMAENLNVGVMVNSVNTGSSHSDVSNNGAIEKYCYDNTASNCNEYGGLYDWNEAMGYSDTEGVQGICPPAVGWHIPTDAEWTQLENYLGGSSIAGGKLKESGTTHWRATNVGATNSSGFTALPGGYRYNKGDFNTPSTNGHFWSSSASSSAGAWYRYLFYSSQNIYRLNGDRTYGFSVRCVRDSVVCTPQPEQANAGPDSLNIEGDSVQLWANTPSASSGPFGSAQGQQWAVVASTPLGNPGIFSDSSAADAWFYGTPGTTYTLVWTIFNQCGATSDTVLIGFATPEWTCGMPFTDPRDGQTYATTHIGSQCWMAENLNVGTMIQVNSNPSNDGIIEKYCYNDDPAMCDIYGGLYQWEEMMEYMNTEGSQGICPSGWHIPADAEWCTLTTHLDPTVNCSTIGSSGTDAGGKMKETGTTHWLSPNTGATNSSGFTALPAGYHYNGTIYFLNATAAFWSSTEPFSSNGIYWYLQNNSATVYRDNLSKTLGLSVRCLRDSIQPCLPQPEQANAGPDSLGISGDSVQLWANTPSASSGPFGSAQGQQWAVVASTSLGNPGIFSDSSAADTWFYGTPGTTYTLVWTISNHCGATSDTVLIGFAPAIVISCGDTITDPRDGKKYPTVEIGTQCWMAKNLNVGTMIMSNPTYTPHSLMSDNGIIEKYCYQNDTTNCDLFGGLYEWNEAMSYSTQTGAQGICPAGWHIPSFAEFALLEGFVDSQIPVGDPVWLSLGMRGYDAGGMLKDSSQLYWQSPNVAASDAFGFTALPAGYRRNTGEYDNLGARGRFWTSDHDPYQSEFFLREIRYNSAQIRSRLHEPEYGMSIRCLRNSQGGNP